MRALVVRPPTAGVQMRDVPGPKRPGSALRVRVLEVGVCGTDRDIVAGEYGTPRRGHHQLILGHENLGIVEEAGSSSRSPRVGDLVVATVRRGCRSCAYCRSGRSDFCASGRYTERGIRGADGYLAEEYVELPQYVVRVPRALRPIAVLLEPLTVVEKAVAMGEYASSRTGMRKVAAQADPPRALVTGTGAVGLLAALLLRSKGYDVSAVDRHGGGTSAAAVLRAIGARHANVADGLTGLGARRFDLIIEASGSVPLDLELPRLIAPNGTLVLTGIPSTRTRYRLVADGTALRSMVLENEAVLGSVNANRSHFERGLRSLAAFQRKFPGVVERLISARIPWENFSSVFDAAPGDTGKSVLVVSS